MRNLKATFVDGKLDTINTVGPLADGKLFCCCGTACCMFPYPYDPTGTTELYPATDLPETIVYTPGFDNFDEGIPVTLTRSGYHFSGNGPSGHVHTISAETSPYQAWTNWDEITGLMLACLITGDGNLTSGNDQIEDQFLGTYTITGFSTAQSSEGLYIYGGPSSIPLDRESLCVWSGTMSASWTFEPSPSVHQEGSGTVTIKLIYDVTGWFITFAVSLGSINFHQVEDPHPSPVGTYQGDWALETIHVA